MTTSFPRAEKTVPPHARSTVGAVVIGRNEGERLRACFSSLLGKVASIVYVDSGSTDGSIELALDSDIEVVHLDMSMPFNCARARNAGFKRLMQVAPSLPFVQFVDGDCELIPGWLDAASAFLSRQADVACACGRLHERYPERSIYNRVLDVAWRLPSGEIFACGGIAMMRTEVVQSLGGFRESLFAGEDNEISARMRAAGWSIWCLPLSMAWHDAEMLHFAQWWKRNTRTGYGYAQWWRDFGRTAGRDALLQAIRPSVWAAGIPLLTFALVLWLGAAGLLLLLVYPAQAARVALRAEGDAYTRLAHGFFLVLGKLPEFVGQSQYWVRRRPPAGSNPFDYKSS